MARVRKTPPDLLTRAPIPWPGPSAPGADMSVPFRLAMLQTGEWFLYPRLPVLPPAGHRQDRLGQDDEAVLEHAGRGHHPARATPRSAPTW